MSGVASRPFEGELKRELLRGRAITERTILLRLAFQIQPQIFLNLFPPVAHHLCLFRVIRPFRHRGADFSDDGFGAAALRYNSSDVANKARFINQFAMYDELYVCL